MPIKLSACVTFPTELTTDDIIDDITKPFITDIEARAAAEWDV